MFFTVNVCGNIYVCVDLHCGCSRKEVSVVLWVQRVPVMQKRGILVQVQTKSPAVLIGSAEKPQVAILLSLPTVHFLLSLTYMCTYSCLYLWCVSILPRLYALEFIYTYCTFIHMYVQALAPVVWWEYWVVYYAIGVCCQAVTGGDFSNSVTQLRMLVAAGLCPV